MTDGDTSPDDASDTAGSGRAHGTAEPRAPFPTVMERVWAHNREKLRQWSLAHPAPSPGPPEPDPAAEPDPPVRARASAGAQADHPDRPGVLRWLPASLQRLYRRLAEAVPYARNTRPRPIPPDDERPSSGQARQYRLEIAYDAFCGHRPPPKKLFRANPWRRDLTSWCDAPNSWTDRRKPRCHHCETARAHYVAARDQGDWKAEVALYKLARRGAVRLLAERRQYRDSRRQFWARHREHVARNGPEPMPPQFEPELWPMIAHRGSHESWHHRDRREVERDLVRAHARHLRHLEQCRRERLRDLHADESAGRKSAQRVPHGRDDADAASPPSPEPRHGEERERRSNPGQREKRLPRDQGSPRRRKPARDGDGRASGATEPPPAAPLRRRRRAGRGDSAMRGRPRDRVLQEAPDLDQRALVEIGPVAAGLEHVPPVAQVVQGDVHLGELLEAAGEHAVEEHHEGVVDDRAGVAQGLAELDLGLAVGGEVLDQQGPLALRDIALDQSIAPEALGLLTDIGHRRHHPVGDPGGEGDAGGLAAGHDLDLLPADLAADLLDAQLTDLRTSAREGDDSAAIHIDGRLPAGGEGVGLGGADVERLDLQQDARGGQRGVAVPVGAVGVGGLVGHLAVRTRRGDTSD